MAGAALAVALTVSLAGYFTETWHWLRVLLERDAFLRVLLERDAFKVWSAIVLGSVGGFGHRFLRPSRPVGRGKHSQDGRIRRMHDRAVLVLDDYGIPSSWHGVTIDITDPTRPSETSD
jgi:hypothetical protein